MALTGEPHARVSMCAGVHASNPPGTPLQRFLSQRSPAACSQEGGWWRLLENLSSATGGLHFEAWNLKDLPSQAAKIGMALHDRYVHGYRPSSRIADGKWRKIQVRLDLLAGSPPLRVYARQTYRSPGR